ncbi:MAG: tRNA (adenosine(37)-N6)-threonylcarbamoyltransferase complex dimerization subunit type 1 TsaB [Planctomycetota bacterium]|jgi:tRNA threonylcarbamoyladenosine biosynthesis protein TsaB
MKVLGIESAGMIGGVALVENDRVLAERIFEKGMVHGRLIAPTVLDLCRQTGTDLADIGLVAVDVGPGSYTGIRVGLAAAKALAFALGRPILGVPSLDALAEAASTQVEKGATLCAAVDARWQQVYGALYRAGNGRPPKRLGGFVTEAPEAFLARVPKGALACGDAQAKYPDGFRAAGVREGGEELTYPKPSVIARIAGRRFAKGKSDCVSTLVPLYLRRTEAEQKLSQKKRKTAGKRRRRK